MTNRRPNAAGIDVHPDMHMVIAASKELASFTVHNSAVRCLAISPDLGPVLTVVT